MKTEIKSDQFDSRRQIIEREIRVHEQQANNLALKSAQIKNAINAHTSDFERLLCCVRDRANAALAPKEQAFKVQMLGQKSKHTCSEIRQQRELLDEIKLQRSRLAGVIHNRRKACDKLSEWSDEIKSSESARCQASELDELASLKASGLQQDLATKSVQVETSAASTLNRLVSQTPARRDIATYAQISTCQTQQPIALRIDQACSSQRGEGVSLNYRSAHGLNFQVAFDASLNGLTVRLKPEDTRARTQVTQRKVEIKRQLERSGVRVDQIICEK